MLFHLIPADFSRSQIFTRSSCRVGPTIGQRAALLLSVRSLDHPASLAESSPFDLSSSFSNLRVVDPYSERRGYPLLVPVLPGLSQHKSKPVPPRPNDREGLRNLCGVARPNEERVSFDPLLFYSLTSSQPPGHRGHTPGSRPWYLRPVPAPQSPSLRWKSNHRYFINPGACYSDSSVRFFFLLESLADQSARPVSPLCFTITRTYADNGTSTFPAAPSDILSTTFGPLRHHPTLETLIPAVSLPSHELICRCLPLSPDAWATRYYRRSGSCPSAGPLPLLRSGCAIGSAPSLFIQTLYGYAARLRGALGHLSLF